MDLKFFKQEKTGEFYLIEWKTGYVQVWQSWTQFLSPKKYNWINIRPVWLEFDYCKMAGDNLSIELGLLGFNLRFHQFIRDNEKGKKLKKTIGKMESLEDSYQRKIKKLKAEIKRLKSKGS